MLSIPRKAKFLMSDDKNNINGWVTKQTLSNQPLSAIQDLNARDRLTALENPPASLPGLILYDPEERSKSRSPQLNSPESLPSGIEPARVKVAQVEATAPVESPREEFLESVTARALAGVRPVTG